MKKKSADIQQAFSSTLCKNDCRSVDRVKWMSERMILLQIGITEERVL